MPGSSGTACSGVRDDATAALSRGAGPLEGYAARFDDLFGSLAQRPGFREYLAGLPAEPVPGGFPVPAGLRGRVRLGPEAAQGPHLGPPRPHPGGAVTAAGNTRLSLAALIATRPGCRTRLIYRTRTPTIEDP
jgi:hypothetical protein